MAVPFAVAAVQFRDAVAAGALEGAVLTGEALALQLVRAVAAVVVVIAPVPARDALK